ncbi:Predicted dithiol-disulfide isomerase, DsbA family [Roseateles sp. YR242]|uniref:DsbA family oxidoreductase n=1 Tax=Roseateles sp. YR242 TaxID=1855305 RepID=UPI0008D89383|nr:DsbA family oxidoreductase [Roseateles sp. YR242]SEL61012.1 Predicted dithiol-disulfide isomerase, DsbA family [Roseateles sp. YR242]
MNDTTRLAPLRIDFVSDVACPWCAVGLKSLETALARLPEVKVDLHFQPFELNPDMPPEGEDIEEHLNRKYRSTPEQRQQIRQHLRERGAAVGFTFTEGARSRIYNTLDAHRLLHWAGLQSAQAQRDLKLALLTAYHTHGKNPGDREVLLETVASIGLDRAQAAHVFDSGEFANEVREAEALWQGHGISSVPAVIINERYLVSGGQPPEAFEQALRQVTQEIESGMLAQGG